MAVKHHKGYTIIYTKHDYHIVAKLPTGKTVEVRHRVGTTSKMSQGRFEVFTPFTSAEHALIQALRFIEDSAHLLERDLKKLAKKSINIPDKK